MAEMTELFNKIEKILESYEGTWFESHLEIGVFTDNDKKVWYAAIVVDETGDPTSFKGELLQTQRCVNVQEALQSLVELYESLKSKQ